MEITTPLELSAEETSLLDMHSVLNVLNAINYELLQISEELGSDDHLFELMGEVNGAADLFRDPDASLQLIQGIETFITRIEQAIDRESEMAGHEAAERIISHRDNLQNIYTIIRIRAREIITRFQAPDAWVKHSAERLNGHMVDFLAAVEKNSHGRYRIVHNVAAKQDGDYLIHFDITSDSGDIIPMPMVFQDVMRDLLANARKYTELGGKIQGGLHAGKDELRFVLEDNGMGIPKDSIQDMVLFGKRAKNVEGRTTLGGGFGLTKAYFVTRRHNGRMWIDSATKEEGGTGTRIEIRIPVP